MARPWQWDAGVMRYRAPNGRFIGPAQMRAERDAWAEAIKGELSNLAGRVSRGEVTIQEFVLEGRSLIKSAHVDAYVLGKGGRGAMTQSDWGKVGAQVKEQYAYWQGFSQAIADGELSEAGIDNRAQMYGDATCNSYYYGTASAADAAGFTEESNVLAVGDNCNGCLDEDARGWVDLGELVPPGERDCGPRCRCSVEYR